MAYDYKKEYKELYKPKTKPHIIHVPAMTFLAVSGQGDPNTEGGDYQQAIELLYGKIGRASCRERVLRLV